MPFGIVRHYDAYAPIYATYTQIDEYEAGKASGADSEVERQGLYQENGSAVTY